MTTIERPTPFKLKNNWGQNGNTYVAIFKVLKLSTFENEEQFKQFILRVKQELVSAKQELFNDDVTDSLGGFDVQVATAGVKDNYIIGTIGGSAHNNLISINPVENIGSMVGKMLNTFFDKEYIFNNQVRDGEFNYSIVAVDIGGTIIKDDLVEDIKQFSTSQTKDVSSLWNYSQPKSNYLDYNYNYYDITSDLVEVSLDLASNLLEIYIDSLTPSNIDAASSCGDLDCNMPDMAIPDCDLPDCDCSGIDCGGLDCGGLDCSP